MVALPSRSCGGTATRRACSRAARRHRSTRSTPERRARAGRGAVERVAQRARAAHSRLEVERLDASTLSLRSVFRSARPTSRSPPEERQDVVAVDALVLALVDLDQVAEAEHALDERPVPEQVVERARGARRRSGLRRARRRPARRRCAAVVDRHARTRPAADECVDVGPLRRTAREAAVLGDPRLGQRAAARDRPERIPPAELVLGGSRRVEIAAEGSRARAGRRAAGTSRARRRRPRRPRTGARARASPASSSTSRRASAPSPRRRVTAARRARGSPRGRAPRSRGPCRSRPHQCRSRGRASAA